MRLDRAEEAISENELRDGAKVFIAGLLDWREPTTWPLLC